VENNISQKHIKMENKKAVKLTDFQKNEENPFMKQAIEGIENHVVKKYMDLKCFDTETFFADRGKLLEFLHGGFLFDYYYSLSYGCGFSLHLLPNRIEISLLHSLTYHKQLFGFLVTL
jgi:hypothetical protein